MKTESGRDIVEWVLTAKGVGIFLVVVGHFHAELSPTYWPEIQKIIYSFHMPLFFILSGYLYTHGKYSCGALLKAKARRLLYPFASIAALFFVVKYAAGMLVTLDHPVTFDSIYTLVFDPVKSYMPLLWFVHALFIIFAVYAPARLCLNNLTILLSVLAVNTIVGSDYPVFGKALANMPFFVFGVMLRENPTISRAAMGTGWRSSAIPLVLFVAAYLIAPISAGTAALRYPVQIFLGASGSLFVISASHAFTEQTHKKAAAAAMQLGYYSMTIYLLHTMFESTLRIGFLQVFKTVQLPFELVACIAIACGLVFPLLLEKNVLRKNSLARKFILGLP